MISVNLQYISMYAVGTANKKVHNFRGFGFIASHPLLFLRNMGHLATFKSGGPAVPIFSMSIQMFPCTTTNIMTSVYFF